MAAHAISPGDAQVLVSDPIAKEWFEALHGAVPARMAAAWLVNELPRVREARALDALPFDASALAALLGLIDQGTLTQGLGRKVLEVMATDGGDPSAIAEARGWTGTTDDATIEALVDQVLAEHPEEVARAKENPRLIGFFVGHVMKASGGRAPGKRVQALLKQRLG